MKKILIISAIILTILAGMGIYYGNNGLFVRSVIIDVSIPKGVGTSKIAEILKKNGIIKSELIFRLRCGLLGKNNLLKSGKASFSPKMSYDTIIYILENKMRSNIKVTIPEGYELWQIADLFVENCNISKEKFYDEVENGVFDYPFMDELSKGKNRLEGYLFPETYYIGENATEHEIIDMCLAQFAKIYTPELMQKAKDMGYNTNQIITLASIIEKESSTDRRLVSSVFHNRINSGKYKYLESCSTVIYVTKTPKARLSAEDIKVDSPYNTYKYKGLPPGPIASPGKESIEAAINPEKSDYYFFSDMGGGKNTFSKTYEEHLAKQN